MESNKLNNLVDIIQCQYRHIVATSNFENPTPQILIEHIVNYYQDIINCMPGNVYWLDKNCTGVGCNKNVLDMFGLASVNDFRGLSFEKMGIIGNWTPEATNAFHHDSLNVLLTGKPKLNIEEPPISHHDGRVIHFLTSRVPLFDQMGNVIGVVGISIDIGELKQTQAALKNAKDKAETANRAKSEFIANLSHDIKTPLAGMIGMAELLTYHLKEQKHLEFAQILLMSGRQLLNFFDNCLEAFKFESDITLITEQFSIRKLLQEITTLFHASIKSKQLDFELRIDQTTPDELKGCRAGLYRILLNLIGNALKFTHQGKIFINVSFSQLNFTHINIHVSIEDTGIGIPNDKFDIIFDRFTRLIPSYKGTYEGSGIGLYIVKRYITAMKGDIQVFSQESKGSRFDITLPFEIDHQPVKPQKVSAQQQEITANKISSTKNILLVEDNYAAQMMQKTLLTSMQCQVTLVDSGEKALEVFEPGKFNLIFLDIGLPGMQGDTVAKVIRKLEQHDKHHTPIVALTAHTTSEVTQQYLISGINAVYSKPLTKENAEEILSLYTNNHEHT